MRHIATLFLALSLAAVAEDRAPHSPATVQAVQQALGVAYAPPADPAALTKAIADIPDPAVRNQVESILPDLKAAAPRQAHNAQFIADVKAVKGVTQTSPGGPAWLRAIAGDHSMLLFDRLTLVDLYDNANAHAKDYKLNDTITDEWLAHLDGMDDLEQLGLANTAIKGPGLKHAANLTKLQRINLTLTPVTDEHLVHFANCSNVKIFSLASAKCDGTGFRFLGKMTQLENVNFHNTPVNDAGLAEICKAISMERLEVVHTQFTDAGAAHFANLKNIQRLQIGSRKATGASVAFLKNLPKLRELDLHDLNNASEALQHASAISTLRVLRVYLGPVTDADAKQITALNNLEELTFPGGQLTDAGIEAFGTLKHLKKINLGATPKASPAALQKLKAALPDLQFVTK